MGLKRDTVPRTHHILVFSSFHFFPFFFFFNMNPRSLQYLLFTDQGRQNLQNDPSQRRPTVTTLEHVIYNAQDIQEVLQQNRDRIQHPFCQSIPPQQRGLNKMVLISVIKNNPKNNLKENLSGSPIQ